MKKTLLIAILALALLLSACGTYEMTMSENTEKYMKVSVKNAGKGDYFMVGTLEVDEGEEILIRSGLEKGELQIEIIGTDEEQSIDEIPDFDSAAVLTAKLREGDAISGTVEPGSYMVKVTCNEKASGTAEIEVQPGA